MGSSDECGEDVRAVLNVRSGGAAVCGPRQGSGSGGSVFPAACYLLFVGYASLPYRDVLVIHRASAS